MNLTDEYDALITTLEECAKKDKEEFAKFMSELTGVTSDLKKLESVL